MNFLQSQETLTGAQWVLRAITSYFFLLIMAKILGQRTISQLRLLDFVIALVIGNIIAHPLSDEHLGLEGSMITTTVLVILYLISIFSILKFPALRRIVNSSPITIVKNGEILYKGLKKARISVDVLLEELREEKVEDVKKVALATWESDGKISVFLDPKYSPATLSDLNIQAEAFNFQRTIVKEGKIISKSLKEIQKDEDWVQSNLKRLYQTEVKNVLLATFDDKGNLKVFLYK
ncbi:MULTISPECIES: DUF421 domain-containing protein [Clostridium]|uniref:DUF421 domain-containing protein n=1 Tax=Clostridium cibarium TaxID=2762247 RepID=A0ABR8PTV1_9CLOT|nr:MULTISPECIES: DUF421 domain-containing protein [Clostridium]MBD7911598.1 DUF421 domain-containing protein [Clostridium cibarium]